MDTNIPQTNNTQAVRDLSVSAFLYSCDEIRLVKIERDQSGNVTFHFFPKTLTKHLISLYRTDDAPPIQPRKLFSSQRDLKDMIFSGVEND